MYPLNNNSKCHVSTSSGTNSLESVEDAFVSEDVAAVATDVGSFDDNDHCLEGPFWTGRGTVGRVHSNTVNGRANDLSYTENRK